MKNSRLPVLGLSSLPLVFSACADGQRTASREDKPNVIFILADDMGYCDLSCYGNVEITTPNIDRLAATGTHFTNAYAGSAISSPSRCALMTGKHSGHTTIRDNFCNAGGLTGLKNGAPIRRMHLTQDDYTLANLMHDAGYRTCLVNKWHLDGFNPGAGPLDRGFDEFYGWLISSGQSNSPYYYPAKRFNNRDLSPVTANEHEQQVRHNTDISTDDAIAFINRNVDNPFFLYLAFDAPHEPYNINDTHWYDEKDWDANSKRYASLISHMDEAVGRLIAELDRLGLRENTIVFFASDNGAAVQAPLELLNCNGSFRGRKGIVYEGGIRVPLIVNCPGKVKEQELLNQVFFPDIMPTLAALSGTEAPEWTDGIDISPLFFGEQVETDNRMLYWEFPGKQIAARKGKWKIVQMREQPFELYDLENDPFETTDLAASEPEILEQMVAEAKTMHRPTPNWPLPGEFEN